MFAKIKALFRRKDNKSESKEDEKPKKINKVSKRSNKKSEKSEKSRKSELHKWEKELLDKQISLTMREAALAAQLRGAASSNKSATISRPSLSSSSATSVAVGSSELQSKAIVEHYIIMMKKELDFFAEQQKHLMKLQTLELTDVIHRTRQLQLDTLPRSRANLLVSEPTATVPRWAELHVSARAKGSKLAPRKSLSSSSFKRIKRLAVNLANNFTGNANGATKAGSSGAFEQFEHRWNCYDNKALALEDGSHPHGDCSRDLYTSGCLDDVSNTSSSKSTVSSGAVFV